MNDQKKGPSIFLGVMTGYLIASAVGALVLTWLFIQAGRATASEGFRLLASVGALGALVGYLVTVRRRKSRGIVGRYDEWSKFIISWLSFAIAMIVITGAFAIAALIKFVYDMIAGQLA